jgi:hypothetical protein
MIDGDAHLERQEGHDGGRTLGRISWRRVPMRVRPRPAEAT